MGEVLTPKFFYRLLSYSTLPNYRIDFVCILRATSIEYRG